MEPVFVERPEVKHADGALGRDAVTDKFRAVLFDEAHADCISKPISSFTHFKLDKTDGFEILYRALTGQPQIVVPPLGPPRKMPPS